ncbi:MAG TPA: MFS transporter, partial [Baekduia sp.]|nr:MFS transporter [Baekduia sp.]
ISAILGIGGGLGVVLAGVIVDHMSYHYLFWFPLIGIFIATVMTYFFVPESPLKTPGKINWLAAVLMSLGIAATLTAVSQGAQWGWGASKTILLMLAGVALIAAWIRVELSADEPLVDMKMMEIKGVWTTNLVAFLLGAGMFSLFLLIPQLVQLPVSTGYGFGATVTEAGLYLLPSTILMMSVGSFAGRFEARFGLKPPLIAGVAFTAAAFVLLIIDHGSSIDIYVSTSLLGIGLGLAYAALPNLIVQNVPPEQTGVATGMNAVMRSLGGAVGGQVVAAMLSSNLTADGHPPDSSFTLAFWFALGSLAVAVAVATLIPSRNRLSVWRASSTPVTE